MFHRRKNVISLSVDEGKCIGCESCVARCKRDVLSMYTTRTEYYAWVKYPMDCVGCAKCVRVCPSDAIELIIE